MEESVKDNINDTEVRNLNSRSGGGSDILVMDIGGGMNCTITKRAFHITDIIENQKTALSGYQDKGEPKLCSVVNGNTKAFIQGKSDPVIFHINFATLIDDKDEMESLCVPFNLMSH